MGDFVPKSAKNHALQLYSTNYNETSSVIKPINMYFTL